MNSQLKDGEKNQVILEIEVPYEEMAIDIKLAGKIIANKVDIPGFRKGKVPQSVLENHVGMEAILEEAAQGTVAKSYMEAVKKHDLHPVCHPQVEIKQMEKDKPLIYTATVTVKPEIVLGEYRGLEASKKTLTIGDAEVEKEIEKSRSRLAKLVDAPEGAALKSGDTAVLDFKGFLGEEAFPGGEAADYSLVLGSNTFIPGFEEQLIGLAAGDKKDVTVVFPEDYQEKSLAGKEAIFKVEIKGVKHKELPELNDDLAKEISENSDTLEQLKAEIKEKMQARMDHNSEEAAKAQVVKKAVENAQMDIPQVMVDSRVENILAEMEHRLQSQGLSFDMYMQYAKVTEEQLRQQYTPQALHDVKTDLVLEAIAKAEDIDVSQEDIDKHIEKMAAQYWQPVDKIREALEKNNAMDTIAQGIKMMKAEELIYNNAVISEEFVLGEVTSSVTEKKAEEQTEAE